MLSRVLPLGYFYVLFLFYFMLGVHASFIERLSHLNGRRAVSLVSTLVRAADSHHLYGRLEI